MKKLVFLVSFALGMLAGPSLVPMDAGFSNLAGFAHADGHKKKLKKRIKRARRAERRRDHRRTRRAFVAGAAASHRRAERREYRDRRERRERREDRRDSRRAAVAIGAAAVIIGGAIKASQDN